MTRILCYHDVVPTTERGRSGFPGPTSARYKLSCADFERHLDALSAAGMRPGLLADEPGVALTFDDGGKSALHVAEALERRGWRGHFLVPTVMLGRPGFLSAEDVRELAARGHEIGSHSHTHPPYIERLARPTLAYEWRRSCERLANVLGSPPRLAAVPGGRLSDALIEQAALAGYEVLLSCEPTLRARRLGPLTVLGRYMIWGNTPAARAAAYARGRRAATGWLEAQWHAKQVARRITPSAYERARTVWALVANSGGDKAGNGRSLVLESGLRRTPQTRADQPPAQGSVVDHQPHSGRGRGGVVGRNQERAVVEPAHAANGGGNGRQAAGVGLDQDLGQTLRAGDVQKSMAAAVQVEQPAVERHISAHGAGAAEVELRQARLERPGHAPLAADDQAPSGVPLSEQQQNVGEEQRVLFGVDAADGEQGELVRVVGPHGGASPGLDIRDADQGDGGREDARSATVAGSEVDTYSNDGIREGEQAPATFERPGGELQQTVSGMAVPNVGGEILPHSEHEVAAPDERDERERDRVRIGPQRKDGVGIVQSSPHTPERAGNGAQHGPELGQAGVVGQRYEMNRSVERVVGRSGPVIETSEQLHPAELTRETADETDERTLREHESVAVAVQVVGVDDQPHRSAADKDVPEAAQPEPIISVLIPVRNEQAVLERTVPTMLGQTEVPGPIEFIFAEGASWDRSRAILERFASADPRVRIVANRSGHTPDALNAALAKARGEYVARMDAHCFYPSNYLADGVARLQRGDVAWVSGPAVPRPHGGFSGTVALALCSPLGRGPSRRLARPGALGERERNLDTGVFAGVWRRSVLMRHGGWDARWLRNQDSELAARFLAAEQKLVSLPTMAAEYVPRRTLRGFAGQYHDYGRYRARTLTRHEVARRRSHMLAPGLVAALPAALSHSAALRTPARATLAAYVAAVGFETVRAAPGAPLSDVIKLPAAFAAMHVAFGMGMWRGLGEAWISRSTNELDPRQRR